MSHRDDVSQQKGPVPRCVARGTRRSLPEQEGGPTGLGGQAKKGLEGRAQRAKGPACARLPACDLRSLVSLSSRQVEWEPESCGPRVLSPIGSVTHTPASHRFLLRDRGPWARGAAQEGRTEPSSARPRLGLACGPLSEMLRPRGKCVLIEAASLGPGAVGAQASVCFAPSSIHLLGVGP